MNSPKKVIALVPSGEPIIVGGAFTDPDEIERMKMKMTTTQRGFSYAEFTDLYGAKCSIQKSSLATDDAIWLGAQTGTHVDGQCLARMHLSRDMAQMLIPLLQHFVDTGELPD